MVTYLEFSAKIKEKYPEYKDVDDKILAEKIVAKYPEYKDRVEFEAATPAPEPVTQPAVSAAVEPFKKVASVAQKILSPKTADALSSVAIGIPASEAAKNVKEVIDNPVDTIAARLMAKKDPRELAESFAIGGAFARKPKFNAPKIAMPEPIVGPRVPGEAPAGMPGTAVKPVEPLKPAIPEPIPASPTPLTPEAAQQPVLTPEQKLIGALKEAGDIRNQQEQIYTRERGQRMAEARKVPLESEAGYYGRLSKFKGEMTKVQYESIRGKVSQEDINSLFKKIGDSSLNEFDQLSASRGLAKMFGEFGGQVPVESELKLLNNVFGKELTDTLLQHRSTFQKFSDAGLQIANVPRALMASFDFSAPLRQGVFFIGRPKQFLPSFAKQFKAFASEDGYRAINEDISRKPTYDLMQQSKLALTDMEAGMSAREEKFMSSWAEKIPLLGRGVRASGRAYSGFLNKLRADVFEDLVTKAEIMGRDPRNDAQLVKEIANFVNAGTGRGNLTGSFERAAPLLNAAIFSPRLVASRLTLLNPGYYIKADPFVRKEALKSLLAFSSVIGTTIGLGKLAGADIVGDPRSADFGKIKVGNTRLDMMGGFQQYVKLASQLISGKMISTTLPGKQIVLGEGFRPLTRLDLVTRFFESKESPIMSFATGLARGTTSIGEDFTVWKEVRDRFVPMVIADAVEIAKDNPKLLPLSALGAFGVGLQTYSNEDMSKEPIKTLRAHFLAGKPGAREEIIKAVQDGLISNKQGRNIMSPNNDTYLKRSAQTMPLKDLADVIAAAKPGDKRQLAAIFLSRYATARKRVKDMKAKVALEQLTPALENARSIYEGN